MGKPRIARIS